MTYSKPDDSSLLQNTFFFLHMTCFFQALAAIQTTFNAVTHDEPTSYEISFVLFFDQHPY